MADLAHSCIAWHSRPAEYGGLEGLDLGALGIPEQPEYERAYYGQAERSLRLAPFHLAFALFRFAVIFEGIAARAREGSAAASNAAEVGNRLAVSFARRAVGVIERA
jgi:aminoglycoside phosphotransferase (APT) family kinase protein